jgi:iron complex outermembrane receptor protein
MARNWITPLSIGPTYAVDDPKTDHSKGTFMLASYRSRLLTSTLLVGAALTAAPAFAQDADPASQPKTGVQSTDPAAPSAGISSQDSAPPAAETTTGDIVVTGSLIRNPNLISSSPIAVIGQEEINLRQSNNAEQILRDLPGVVPSIGAQVNNGNGGASFADLRGLGNFRNVVLLDGTRITPSSVVGRVDLNNIPLALIERVETLTGGAATTYGADAVSGVVNFITRSDFTGLELNVGEQITEQGDGEQTRVDLTLGTNFADDRGNVVLSLGYQNSDPIYQGARKISFNNYTSTSGGRGGSGTTVPGRFTVGSVQNTIQPESGALRPYVGSTDGFNFNPYNVFQTPFKRFNMYGAGHYEVSDNIEVYGRGLFSKNTVNTVIAPSGLFASAALIPFSNPYLPASARATFCANNPAFAFPGGGTPVAVGRTLTAAECTAAAGATSISDPNFRAFTTTIGRRSTEAGARESEFVTQVFDFRAGVKVGITDSLSLDVSGSYGESENRQNQTGYVLTSRARTALFATNTTSCLAASPAVTGVDSAGRPIVIVAGGAGTNAGSGCVPINIFGADGSIAPGQLPYLTADSSTRQFSSLAQARALLTGDFGFSSPFADNPIGFAVGAEYRKYKGSQSADTLSQTAGELGGAGGAVLNFEGGYEVKEAYGELNAPLISNRPLFQSLTLEAGVRYSDYKVFAAGSPSYNTTTYKGGGSWEPFDGLKLRGNYQRAVRAPNIAELFSPPSTALTNLATDPCRTTRNAAGVVTYAGPLGNANLAAVCLAQGAPAASIGNIANPTANQPNFTSSGSLTLRPETSDSYTFGVVIQPRNFIPGLSITVDYYNIKIKDAISQPLPGDAIAACFGDSNATGVGSTSATNPACLSIRRDPVTGSLSGDAATTPGLGFTASNQGRILTDGIDLGVNYRRDLGFTKLNLSFQGNWTNRSRFQATAVSLNRECVGRYSSNCGSPGSAGPSSAAGSLQPEFTWNQRTTLTFGPADVSLLWRHIDSMKVEDGVVAFAGTLGSGALAGKDVDFGRIKAYDYFDLSTRVGLNDNVDFTFTVTNLLNKEPPIVGGTIGSTSFNSGNTYPSTYDAIGRRFAIGARFKL